MALTLAMFHRLGDFVDPMLRVDQDRTGRPTTGHGANAAINQSANCIRRCASDRNRSTNYGAHDIARDGTDIFEDRAEQTDKNRPDVEHRARNVFFHTEDIAGHSSYRTRQFARRATDRASNSADRPTDSAANSATTTGGLVRRFR